VNSGEPAGYVSAPVVSILLCPPGAFSALQSRCGVPTWVRVAQRIAGESQFPHRTKRWRSRARRGHLGAPLLARPSSRGREGRTCRHGTAARPGAQGGFLCNRSNREPAIRDGRLGEIRPFEKASFADAIDSAETAASARRERRVRARSTLEGGRERSARARLARG